MSKSRREAIKLAVGSTALIAIGSTPSKPAFAQKDKSGAIRQCSPESASWPRNAEGSRTADVGNGHYRNPIIAGDYPDPTVLKDGDDYYMTHSSIDAMPGLLIWHSRDLVNWSPVCAALPKPLGTVFACDLIKHDGRYFIYIPFMKAPWSENLKSFANIYVIHADNIAGPWSDPVDLDIGGFIDPGHIVSEDGERWLYLSGVSKVKLSANGLAVAGPVEHAYDGWRYPEDWIVEGYSLEGPKLMRRGDWFYLISAVGGTGGPATGHMVIAARSPSATGPWENCPHNPIVRSQSDAEPWHSRGHATAVEGPGGQWYLIYHGYENGYRTLGRQTLLEPIEWTADDWPRAIGGDLSQPMPMLARPSLFPPLLLSDDFSADALGTRWTLHINGAPDSSLAQVREGSLWLRAKGSGPQDGTVVTQQTGNRAYQAEVTMTISDNAEGGLLLYFSDRLFLGIGHDGKRMITYGGGRPGHWREPAPPTRQIHLRVVNDHHIITYYWSIDGKNWTRHAIRAEASGCHANAMQDLSSLRPALYASGKGNVRFTKYRFQGLA
jgi:xylan 1,4-beta-xylosidase